MLNLFCYTGGFSIYALGAGAVHVDSVDSSQRAMDMVDRNVAVTQTYGGNYSASTMMIKTAFVSDYGNSSDGSPLFDKMLENRAVIAERIAKDDQLWREQINQFYTDTVSGYRFPVGYGPSNSRVLLYSFLSAYGGTDASDINLSLPFESGTKWYQNIPLPNWSLSYNGLSNIPALAEIFKTINITHSYKSNVTINNWASNIYYNDNQIQFFENTSNIVPKYDISQIVITEQFAPLIGIDVGFQNTLTCNFQFKKSRSLTMSFTNNQLTEINGREIVVGAGFRVKGLTFNLVPLGGGNGKKTFKNDLVLKVDLGFKKDKTVLRRIDENNNQVSAGQNRINIYITGDYQFSSRLSAQVFFKHDMNSPFVSNTYPTSTTFAGMMVRFNLAQ